MNGAVSVDHGAFVHDYRPDWDSHKYGVVVGTTPKAFALSSILGGLPNAKLYQPPSESEGSYGFAL
jgi:hypothetical protein